MSRSSWHNCPRRFNGNSRRKFQKINLEFLVDSSVPVVTQNRPKHTPGVDLKSAGFTPAARSKSNQEPSTMNAINMKKHRQSRLLRMPFLLGAFLCVFPMMAEKTNAKVPRGVFCLLGAGQGTGAHSRIYSD